MRLTVFSFKGGVAKTTTALHLAAYLAERGSTLLIDGDPNLTASEWAEDGQPSFTVCTLEQLDPSTLAGYVHRVVDTAARPSEDELKDLVGETDLMVLPCPPDAFALRGAIKTAQALERVGASYKVLLTMVPPFPSRDALEARVLLEAEGLPLFRGEIRRAVAFSKAALAGVVARDVRGDARASSAWADYEAIGREILS